MSLVSNPIFQSCLTAAGLLGALVLFLNLNRQLAELRNRMETEVDALRTAVELTGNRLERLEASIEDRCELPNMLPQTASPGSSMNLNKRGEVLRLHRRGEPAERIANALQLPRNEVELLLKVHKTVIELA